MFQRQANQFVRLLICQLLRCRRSRIRVMHLRQSRAAISEARYGDGDLAGMARAQTGEGGIDCLIFFGVLT